MANLKIIAAGIACMALSAFLFLDYGRIFGVITSQPGMDFYMQWFFAGAALISVLIVIIGLVKPGS